MCVCVCVCVCVCCACMCHVCVMCCVSDNHVSIKCVFLSTWKMFDQTYSNNYAIHVHTYYTVKPLYSGPRKNQRLLGPQKLERCPSKKGSSTVHK